MIKTEKPKFILLKNLTSEINVIINKKRAELLGNNIDLKKDEVVKELILEYGKLKSKL